MRRIKHLGNYDAAYNDLKNDKNNAVAYLFPYNTDFYTKDMSLSKAVLTIKDNYATKCAPTSGSSKILENFEPGYSATAVKKLYANGAHFVAKVHLDELALGGTGTYSGYGLITNPLDKNRYAGGSSSGSVATFNENISIALGSDTGDSVRLPGSYNGIPGFKPSYGAISRYGLYAYASSLDTVAYFAHNVNDIIAISQVLYGKDNKDMTSVDVEINDVVKRKPNSVIALDFSEFCEDYINDAYQQLLQKLSATGIKVEKIKPNIDILRCVKPAYEIISYSEASSNLANLTGIGFANRIDASSWEEIIRSTRSKHFGKMVQERLSLGSYFLYAENVEEMLFKAQKARRVIVEYWKSLQDQGDLVIFPAFAAVAPTFDAPKDYDVMSYILTTANLAGNPSITLPLAKHHNLPFSIALETKIYDDKKLLAYAEWFEELIGEKHE
ncbi:amidase family protein [Mycoplasma sp. AC1221]